MADSKRLGYREPLHVRIHAHTTPSYNAIVKPIQDLYQVESQVCLYSKDKEYTNIYLRNNRKQKTNNLKKHNQYIYNCILQQ